MRILAIDPGPTESAWVVWDGVRIGGFSKEPNNTVLRRVIEPHRRREFSDSADQLAIEMIASYGMAVGETTFETVYWIGRFVEAFGASRCDRVKRLIVKQHLCHDSRAKDGNIIQALKDRFGDKGTKKAPGLTYGMSGDCWQAFALAVTWFDLNAGSKVA